MNTVIHIDNTRKVDLIEQFITKDILQKDKKVSSNPFNIYIQLAHIIVGLNQLLVFSSEQEPEKNAEYDNADLLTNVDENEIPELSKLQALDSIVEFDDPN